MTRTHAALRGLLPRVPHLSRAAAVALPFLVTLAAALLQLAVLPRPALTPFVVYFVAVAISAWFGGLASGLGATALSALAANALFIAPAHGGLPPGSWAATGLFVFGATVLAILCAAFRTVLLDTEAASLESRRLSELLRLANDAIIVWRVPADSFPAAVESWNHGAEELYGYPAEVALGKNPHDLLGTVTPSSLVWDEIYTALQQHGDWQGELVHRGRDGREVVVSSRLRMVEGEDGVARIVEVNRDITERRRAEQALRRYELLDAHSRDVILFIRVDDGRIMEANQQAVRAYGYTRDELLKLTIADIRSADRRDIKRQLEEASDHGVRFEVTHRRKDGSTFPVEVASQGATMAGTRTVISVIRDITERRQAEHERERLVANLSQFSAELQQSQRQLKAVFESMVDGVVVVDMKGETIMVNRAEAEMYGFASAEEVKRSVAFFSEAYELFTPDGRQLPTSDWPVSRVLRGESLADVELRARRRDLGREWWLSFSGQPVRDEHERPALAVVITRDITERRAAEEALRRSEQRFRVLADAMPQLVWTATPDGTVDYYNLRYREMGGIERSQVADGSWTWTSVIHPDDREATLDAWQRAIRDGTPYEMAHRVCHADGSYRWFLSRGIPVRDDAGKIIKWYGTATDIDEQKKAEDALRESDRRKNEFLAMLSHELRNPLAPIRNSIYILERAQPGSEQAKRAHAVIDRQVRHMTRLVDDLLDITRISRGKIRLQKERLGLGQLLRRVIEDHRSVFAKNGVELTASLPQDAIEVEGDPTRIAQIIGNLLQNAAKFTPRGGRTALRLDSSGPWALIHVVDTGAGMSRQTLSRLFEPFAQADTTLDRNPGGLGLGLALAKGLAELHGGNLTADSAGPGHGSEFVLHLPMAQARAQERHGAFATTETGAEPSQRILVIEDNLDAAESLKEVLELSGHAVELATTGPDGIEKARTFHPDVVLCDIGLPGLDGYEVARRMRADTRLAHVRLIALSGYAAPEDIERSRHAGFEDHLAKPLSLTQLEHRLTHIRAREDTESAQPA